METDRGSTKCGRVPRRRVGEQVMLYLCRPCTKRGRRVKHLVQDLCTGSDLVQDLCTKGGRRVKQQHYGFIGSKQHSRFEQLLIPRKTRDGRVQRRCLCAPVPLPRHGQARAGLSSLSLSLSWSYYITIYYSINYIITVSYYSTIYHIMLYYIIILYCIIITIMSLRCTWSAWWRTSWPKETGAKQKKQTDRTNTHTHTER